MLGVETSQICVRPKRVLHHAPKHNCSAFPSHDFVPIILRHIHYRVASGLCVFFMNRLSV